VHDSCILKYRLPGYKIKLIHLAHVEKKDLFEKIELSKRAIEKVD